MQYTGKLGMGYCYVGGWGKVPDPIVPGVEEPRLVFPKGPDCCGVRPRLLLMGVKRLVVTGV